MVEKIVLTRLQRLRNTDPIFYDHIIEAITEEIEKAEPPYLYEYPFDSEEDYASAGWRDCRQKILSIIAL